MTTNAKKPGWLELLSGKALEQKITEFAEVYGEVLLGIDKEMLAHSKMVESAFASVTEQQKAVTKTHNSLHEGLEAIHKYRAEIASIHGETVKIHKDSTTRINEVKTTTLGQITELEASLCRMQSRDKLQLVAIAVLAASVILLGVKIWILK